MRYAPLPIPDKFASVILLAAILLTLSIDTAAGKVGNIESGSVTGEVKAISYFETK